MSGMLSWFRKDKTAIKENQSEDAAVLEKEKPEVPASPDSLQDRVGTGATIDSQVADYFKDFPEPYRTKAIERFSKRDGLLRWEIFRKAAMEREMDSARQGVFLEDRRDWLKQRDEMAKRHMEKVTLEAQQGRDEREIPAWEKFVLQYVPLQDDESMGWKLMTVANFSLLGAAILWQGIKFRRSNPHLERWLTYMQMTGSVGLCSLSQVGAAYRLMDWGPFDRSIDKRDVLSRALEDAKYDWDNLLKYARGKDS